MGESKKSKAYRLFSEGKTSTSPEVKALKLKASTRYRYFSRWNKTGKPDHVPHQERAGVGGTPLEGDEMIGGYEELATPVKAEAPVAETASVREVPESAEDEEDDEEFEASEEEVTPETDELLEEHKPKIELGLDGNDKQSVSADVVGFGLPIRVHLSLKTLTLYQIAASRSEDDLTLGDFIDVVAEDYFRGRGRDLGLIELEVKNVG